MTTTEHQHHWERTDELDETGGGYLREVTICCTCCPEVLKRLTARTDAEIHAEIDKANG